MLDAIGNDEQYENALKKVYSLMQKDIKPGSKESDELDILTDLIKDYEHVHYPVPKLNLQSTSNFF